MGWWETFRSPLSPTELFYILLSFDSEAGKTYQCLFSSYRSQSGVDLLCIILCSASRLFPWDRFDNAKILVQIFFSPTVYSSKYFCGFCHLFSISLLILCSACESSGYTPVQNGTMASLQSPGKVPNPSQGQWASLTPLLPPTPSLMSVHLAPATAFWPPRLNVRS